MCGENEMQKIKEELLSLRQTVNSLKAMIEIRADGSASWRIPERYERRHSNDEGVRKIALHQ